MKGYILKCTPSPRKNPASAARRLMAAQSIATTITPRRPSELPRVEMVMTIGFRSQTLAYLRAVSRLIGRFSFPDVVERSIRRTRYRSHPATTSEAANTTLPKENQAPPRPSHVVGRSNQASSGV